MVSLLNERSICAEVSEVRLARGNVPALQTIAPTWRAVLLSCNGFPMSIFLRPLTQKLRLGIGLCAHYGAQGIDPLGFSMLPVWLRKAAPQGHIAGLKGVINDGFNIFCSEANPSMHLAQIDA